MFNIVSHNCLTLFKDYRGRVLKQYHPLITRILAGTKMFQAVMDHDSSEVTLGVFDFRLRSLKEATIRSARQAAEALQDPETNFVQIGSCEPEEHEIAIGVIVIL